MSGGCIIYASTHVFGFMGTAGLMRFAKRGEFVERFFGHVPKPSA